MSEPVPSGAPLGGPGLHARATSGAEPATVRVAVLGPLRTEIGDAPVDAGGPRQRAVLARLVAAGGHVVPTDRFIDDLWHGEPPPKALAALQVYVSNLRRALEPGRAPRTPATVVVSVAPGYALRLPGDQVDAWRFEALLRRGSDMADSDPRAADPLLRAALDAWAGPAYAEFADESWATPEAVRLEELRLVCVETAGRVALRLGRAAFAVPELDRHVQAHPLREEAVHLLATALYRAGRQADALAALRDARRRLSDELGVDPGPSLRALEADVLAHAPHLSADTAPPIAVSGVAVAPVTAGDVTSPPGEPAGPARASAARLTPDPSGTKAATSAAADSGSAETSGAAAGATAHAGAASAGLGVSTGAIGRDAELAELTAIAHAASRSGLQIVWVGGEAGAGKTTLLRAFGTALSAWGWRVAWGRCPEVDGAPPAWAWSEVLGDLTGDESDRGRTGRSHDAAGISHGAAGVAGTESGRRTGDSTGDEGRTRDDDSTGDEGRTRDDDSTGGEGRTRDDDSTGGEGRTRDDGRTGDEGRTGGSSSDGSSSDRSSSDRSSSSGSSSSGRNGIAGRDIGEAAGRLGDERLRPLLEGQGGGNQFQLAQAVGERLGEAGPLLVVLDDVHRADGETLQVLRHVAVALGERCVLIVATFRPGEAQPQLGSARAALAGPRSSDLTLGGLGAEAAAQVLAGHLGAPLDAETVAVVHERTGGNPLFLAETARLISAEGARSAVRAIPSGIGHVLRRRLARLPAPAQTVLRHAAILGRDVDIDVLAEAFTEDEDAVLDALEAGVLAGLLEEPAPGRVRFGHALLRDVLYEDMPQLRRRRLHARVLGVLERTKPADVAALGYHALAAATPATAEQAAGHAAAAARQATALFAHREAAQLYAGALEALGLQRSPGAGTFPGAANAYGATNALTIGSSGTTLSGSAHPSRSALDLHTQRQGLVTAGDASHTEAALRLDLLCGLVSARANSGDAIGARAARTEAVEAARVLPGVEPLARALAAFDAPVAWTIRVARTVDQPLVALMERVLAGPDLPAAVRCRMLTGLVYELEGSDLPRCDSASSEALAIAHAEGDALLLCQALNARYFAVLNPQRRHELPSVGERLLEAAERAGSLGFQTQAHHVLYQVALERTDLELAQRHLDRALERSTAGQLGVTLLVMAMLGAIRALYAGDHATAERLYTELGEQIEAAGQPNATMVGIGGVFFVRLAQGLGHTSLPVLEPLRQFAPAEVDEMIVRALIDGGRLDEARARWTPDVPIRQDYYWLAWMGVRAENALALRDTAMITSCYEVLLPWAGQFTGLASGSVSGPPVDLLLGRLAEALDRPAEAHFAAGRELAARTGATPWM